MENSMKGSDLLVHHQVSPMVWMPTWLHSVYEPEYGHNFPIFRLSLVPTIQKDPRIRYGLNLLKGPILAYTAFYPEDEAENPLLHETIREQGVQFVYGIRCEDKEAQKFILRSLQQLWQNGVQELLLALDWGYSCCQVNYVYKKAADGSKPLIYYDSLEHIHPFNVAPRHRNGKLLGARVRGVEGGQGGTVLSPPKIIWHVHAKEQSRLRGQSRLEWAFVPWHETWVEYGARDIRRTWFYRNSYDGGTMRYPIGKSRLDGGNVVDNRDLAVQYMTQMRTGGTRIFPSDQRADARNPDWDFDPPSANVTPAGLMEYPEVLRIEILEAMGIPPEVVEGGGGGLGSSSGREIPMLAYHSTLYPLVNNLINDFKKFVLDYLLWVNFKKEIQYDIYKVIPLKSQEPMPKGVPGQPTTKPSTKTPKKAETKPKPKPKPATE